MRPQAVGKAPGARQDPADDQGRRCIARRRAGLQAGQRFLEGAVSLVYPAARIVKEVQAFQALSDLDRLALRHRPAPGCAHVVNVGGNVAGRLALLCALQMLFPGLEKGSIIPAVRIARLSGEFRGLAELFHRKLSQQLLHVIAPGRVCAQHRLVDQGGQHKGTCVGDGLCCVAPKTALEDAQCVDRAAFALGKILP